MTPYQTHVAKWSNCTKCSLCKNRTNVVFARGTIPCDVLFIGEAPGASEDVLRKPFIGPAGKLLDDLIFDATGILTQKQVGTRIAFTNLVICLPDSVEGKIQPPNEIAVKACAPRLVEFITLCEPSIVILTGKLTTEWFPSDKFPDVLKFEIIHPSAILQMDISRKGLAIKRTTEMIKKAFDSLVPF